jgi:two-component system LytT family sensor kinase
LGLYNVDNKKLTIETYSIKRLNKISSVSIYNKEFRPAEILRTSLVFISSKDGSAESVDNLKNGFKFKIHDGTRALPSILLAIKEVDPIAIYHVDIKNMSTGKTRFVSNDWFYDNSIVNKVAVPNLRIDYPFYYQPGQYQIIIPPRLSAWVKGKAIIGKSTTLTFTVLPSETKYSIKTMLFIALSIILFAAIVILYNRAITRKKLIAQQKEKDLAEVQLSAVRSQLNPHFLFNALAGIQNQMNKNEVDQANRYLTKFARLTRNVLKSNELISITDEVALLEDYLQMEQLRFGFTYRIETDINIDADNTEIPAMLLQPFVENAVKHGIANKGADGKVAVEIKREANGLVLSITDNGKGFDTQNTAEGLGIPLSQRRVALLNKIYKQAPTLLAIQSDATGAKITLTLTHWLLYARNNC